MTEISFYQVKAEGVGAVDATVPYLLEKVIAAGHNVVVKCPTQERMMRLNETLWTYEPSSFLPHGAQGEAFDARQPIYLTTQDDAPNGADVLVVLNGAPVPEGATYAKILDMFDASDTQVKAARRRWKMYKEAEHALVYYAHENGKWVKKA